MMKRTNVLAQCSMNGASAAERAYFVRVPTGVRAMTKASWLILFVSLLLGCAGVTDDDRSGSESESMIINEGAVLGDVSVLDQGGLIEGRGRQVRKSFGGSNFDHVVVLHGPITNPCLIGLEWDRVIRLDEPQL